MSSKKTLWYIRQFPKHVLSINRVTRYDEQFDGAHIRYIERDFGNRQDPYWREEIEAVVPRDTIARSYTEAANRVREILKEYNEAAEDLEDEENEIRTEE